LIRNESAYRMDFERLNGGLHTIKKSKRPTYQKKDDKIKLQTMRLVSDVDTISDFLKSMVNDNNQISEFNPIMCKFKILFQFIENLRSNAH
jgi:hypothetical protein